MIPIVCDSCHSAFQVPPAAAGTTIACPACGAANGVPADLAANTAAPGRSPTSGASSRGGTPASPARRRKGSSTLAPGEEVLLNVHQAMFRARPLAFSGLAILLVGGLIAGLAFLVTGAIPLAILFIVVALAAAATFGVWKILSMDTRLEITTKRTIAYRGLLSKSSSEVMHDDIKNFQIDQSFYNRIFGVGHIGISSSGQDGVEIQMRSIPQPYRVKDLIGRYRSI